MYQGGPGIHAGQNEAVASAFEQWDATLIELLCELCIVRLEVSDIGRRTRHGSPSQQKGAEIVSKQYLFNTARLSWPE